MERHAFKTLIFMAAFGLMGCLYSISAAWAQATTEKVSDSPEPQISSYTLRLDDPLRHLKPLPDKFPITVVIHFADGSQKDYVAANGWDFNSDGRIDMMQIRDKDGDDTAYVFDFDGDSKPDFVKLRAPKPRKDADKWIDHFANEQEALFAKSTTSPEGMVLGEDGKVLLPGLASGEQKNIFKRFWRMDLGLDFTSMKLHAVDKRTKAKADFYSKSNGALLFGVNYQLSEKIGLIANTSLRVVQFEKSADSGFLDDKQKMLNSFFLGVGYGLFPHVHTAFFLGADHQLFLESENASEVAFKKLLIPKVKWDLGWHFFEKGSLSAGVLGALDYGFGAKSGPIEAEADLGYQLSLLGQKRFANSLIGIQLDYRHQAQITHDVAQGQSDLALVASYGLILGGGKK